MFFARSADVFDFERFEFWIFSEFGSNLLKNLKKDKKMFTLKLTLFFWPKKVNAKLTIFAKKLTFFKKVNAKKKKDLKKR